MKNTNRAKKPATGADASTTADKKRKVTAPKNAPTADAHRKIEDDAFMVAAHSFEKIKPSYVGRR
jgi:hypothetical protein